MKGRFYRVRKYDAKETKREWKIERVNERRVGGVSSVNNENTMGNNGRARDCARIEWRLKR